MLTPRQQVERELIQPVKSLQRYYTRGFLLFVWGNQCLYCLRKLTIDENPETDVTFDHVIPQSDGGPDSFSNYVPACAACNSNRRDIEFVCALRASGRTDEQIQLIQDKLVAARSLDHQKPREESLDRQLELFRRTQYQRSTRWWQRLVDGDSQRRAG